MKISENVCAIGGHSNAVLLNFV